MKQVLFFVILLYSGCAYGQVEYTEAHKQLDSVKVSLEIYKGLKLKKLYKKLSEKGYSLYVDSTIISSVEGLPGGCMRLKGMLGDQRGVLLFLKKDGSLPIGIKILFKKNVHVEDFIIEEFFDAKIKEIFAYIH